MNNLSINRAYFNRGDAEARRKIWSGVANLRSGRVIVTHGPNLPIVLRVSAPPRFKTFCSFLPSMKVLSGFEVHPLHQLSQPSSSG